MEIKQDTQTLETEDNPQLWEEGRVTGLWLQTTTNVLFLVGKLINLKKSRNPFLAGGEDEEKQIMTLLEKAYEDYEGFKALLETVGSENESSA